jgi:hypothetical protein
MNTDFCNVPAARLSIYNVPVGMICAYPGWCANLIDGAERAAMAPDSETLIQFLWGSHNAGFSSGTRSGIYRAPMTLDWEKMRSSGKGRGRKRKTAAQRRAERLEQPYRMDEKGRRGAAFA